MRIGVDVGGTHTDAVILDGDEIIAATKSLTTADVVSGISNALDEVLGMSGVQVSKISSVMIGTTQFTNAIVERKSLTRIAAVRLGLPSGKGMPPMIDWPEDMRAALNAQVHMLHGGHLFDGRQLADLRKDEIKKLVEDLKKDDIKNIALSAAFSPMNAEPELQVAKAISDAIPDVQITLSHEFGRLGLMTRSRHAG